MFPPSPSRFAGVSPTLRHHRLTARHGGACGPALRHPLVALVQIALIILRHGQKKGGGWGGWRKGGLVWLAALERELCMEQRTEQKPAAATWSARHLLLFLLKSVECLDTIILWALWFLRRRRRLLNHRWRCTLQTQSKGRVCFFRACGARVLSPFTINSSSSSSRQIQKESQSTSKASNPTNQP